MSADQPAVQLFGELLLVGRVFRQLLLVYVEPQRPGERRCTGFRRRLGESQTGQRDHEHHAGRRQREHDAGVVPCVLLSTQHGAAGGGPGGERGLLFLQPEGETQSASARVTLSPLLFVLSLVLLLVKLHTVA